MKNSQACFFSEKEEGERTMGWVEIISEKVAFQPTLTPWLTRLLLWGKNVLSEYNMNQRVVVNTVWSFNNGGARDPSWA